MNWKFIINSVPLGSGDAVSVVSGSYATRRKEYAWIPAAISAAVGLGSSIFGGATSLSAEKRAQEALDQQKADNEAWYNRKYNEHTIDTAAGQNMIRMAKDYARQTWKKAAGAAAVGGGTDADVAEAKESGNKMMGNVVAQIEAQDVARKDNIDMSYRASQARLNQQQISIDQQHSANIATAASGAGNAIASGISSLSYYGGKGSPGGGGVNPATKTDQLKKMGIDTNEKWLKKNQDKIYDYNNNYNLLQSVMGDYA